MAIRYVSFIVSEDTTVTPTTPQYGGVQGEHNATELAFIIATSGPLANDNYSYYIECVDAAGGYDRTARLYRHGNEISTRVPLAWTQYGGISTVRLVVEEEGVVIYSVEGRLQFEDRGAAIEQVDGLLRTDISACMQASHAAADAAQAAADDCMDALTDARALSDELGAAIDALPPIDTAIADNVLWSSKHTVDELCPLIDMSGQQVVCYPMANHPLQVTVSRPNYLPFTHAPSGTWSNNGITFTRQEDDSILVNGTATDDAYYVLSEGGEWYNPLVEAGITAPVTLILSGCPSGGGSSSYYLYYDTGAGNAHRNEGGNTTLRVTAEDLAVTGGWECYILIKQGVTCNNLVFRPRLEPIGTVRLTHTFQDVLMISELKTLGEMSIMPTNKRMMFSVTPNATLRVRGYGSIPTAIETLDGQITELEETTQHFCPDFEVTGATVICHPVGKSAMQVTVSDEATTITRCGKNLWSLADYHSEGSTIIDVTNNVYTRTFRVEAQTGTLLSESVITNIYNGFADLPAGEYTFSANAMTAADGTAVMPYLTITLADGTTSSLPAGETTVIEQSFRVGAVMCKSSVFTAGYVYSSVFQLEHGAPSAYEPYRKATMGVSDTGEMSVIAWDGANALYADAGTITVKGKENPAHAIDELRRAVRSLGGHVSWTN